MKVKLFFVFLIVVLASCNTKEKNYVCAPCDLACDALTFSKSGTCPQCSMGLIYKDKLANKEKLTLNEIDIQRGSGVFLIEGGRTNKDKVIKVFYHKPENFSNDSKVLLVIPGAGRNADSYRDTWLVTAEKHGVLILSPQYPEPDYEFGDYHLGGLVKDLNLEGNIEFVENTNFAKLNEENVVFNFNDHKEAWIFNDFDRIFDLVKSELDLSADTYDLFGHSAGGHILHRMALFHQNSKADRIIASNPSFYTLPNFENTYPFGLKDTSVDEASLKTSFAKNLVVFLGELDNENETGGTFLRSKSADEQGLHRLERGNYFFETAKEKAKRISTDFNWQIVIVPSVGHNQKKMGNAAGDYLYNLN